MPVYPITTKYTASSLIRKEQMPQFYESGVRLIICNRPDDEADACDTSERMSHYAAQAGIAFTYIPFKMPTMDFSNIDPHTEAVATARGKVIAYCASGRRSVMAWAFEHAKIWQSDKIIAHAMERGIDISGMRIKLDEIHSRGLSLHPLLHTEGSLIIRRP